MVNLLDIRIHSHLVGDNGGNGGNGGSGNAAAVAGECGTGEDEMNIMHSDTDDGYLQIELCDANVVGVTPTEYTQSDASVMGGSEFVEVQFKE